MNVYAIHRKNIFNTEYNVKICSSKKVAEEHTKELNAAYEKWCEEKKKLSFDSIDYLNFIYFNPQPWKHTIEKLEVTKK